MGRLQKCLLAAAVCALALGQSAAAQDVKKLKMMYTAVNGFSAAYVAQEQGFFKKRGIDMEFVLTQSSGNNPPALVSNSVQVAGPTLATLLQAVDAGLDLVVIAGGAVWPLPGDVLVARPGSGIEKPADLKGKRVGVPGLGALLHVMLVKNLKANGVDPKDVKFVEMGFGQVADGLKAGTIDAYPSQAPFTARILQSGAGYEVANWLKSTPDGTLTVVFATTRKWAEDNRATVAGLKDGLKEAVAFIKDNKDATNQAIATYTKLPPQVVASIPPPNLTVDVTPDRIKYWLDICKEQGLIKTDIDPAKVIFNP